jgi:hypothetical protein
MTRVIDYRASGRTERRNQGAKKRRALEWMCGKMVQYDVCHVSPLLRASAEPDIRQLAKRISGAPIPQAR